MQKEAVKDLVIVEKPNLNFEDHSGNLIRLISKEDESYLEYKMEEMIKFMRENHSQEISEEEKDKLYEELRVMWNEVSGKNGGRLNDTNFQLILHRQEYNFLVDLLRNKMEYNVDTIFFAIELTNMIEKMVENSKFDSDSDAKGFDMTPVDVHYLYQLLTTHKVKGLTKSSIYFAEVIKRIALASKVFNYYKESYDNIAKAIQLWVGSLDKGVILPENNKAYQLIWGGSDIKPKFITVDGGVDDGIDKIDL